MYEFYFILFFLLFFTYQRRQNGITFTAAQRRNTKPLNVFPRVLRYTLLNIIAPRNWEKVLIIPYAQNKEPAEKRVLHLTKVTFTKIELSHMHVSLPACLPVFRSTLLPACLSVCLPVCMSACLPVCMPSCLPTCLFVCLPSYNMCINTYPAHQLLLSLT